MKQKLNDEIIDYHIKKHNIVNKSLIYIHMYEYINLNFLTYKNEIFFSNPILLP